LRTGQARSSIYLIQHNRFYGLATFLIGMHITRTTLYNHSKRPKSSSAKLPIPYFMNSLIKLTGLVYSHRSIQANDSDYDEPIFYSAPSGRSIQLIIYKTNNLNLGATGFSGLISCKESGQLRPHIRLAAVVGTDFEVYASCGQGRMP